MSMPADIRVHITGFGPFNRIRDNPSFSITQLLPANHTFTSHATGATHTIHLSPRPSAVRVSYSEIDTLPCAPPGDYTLHIGVGRKGGYVLETCAWENGYIKRDVDKLIPSSPCGDRPPNSSLTDKTAEHKTEEDSGVEFDGVHGSEVPAKGWGQCWHTAADVDWIVEFVDACKITAPENKDKPIDIRKSRTAGMYLCEYIYRHSLMETKSREDSGKDDGSMKKVLFLHVPPNGELYGLETGKEVVLRVIEAMVRNGEGLQE